MLPRWMNMLPLFVVKWIAQRYGERFLLNTITVIQATPGVFLYRGES